MNEHTHDYIGARQEVVRTPLRIGHGTANGHHTHYVVRRQHPTNPMRTIIAPACGHFVAGFEVNDAGEASCGSCKRAANSPRVGKLLLRIERTEA
jgi:hypothetical protein